MMNLAHGVGGLSIAAVCLAFGTAVSQDDDLPELQNRLENLREEFRVAERSRFKALNDAETPQATSAAAAVDPWAPLRERFDTLAFDASGTEVAAGAWATICVNELRYGTPAPAFEAFGILINDHPNSDELIPVVGVIWSAGRDNPHTAEGLRQLSEDSENRDVRGGALFGLAKLLESADATKDEAFEIYRKITADYADVASTRGSTLGEMSAGALFEAEHLQVGMAVPDIASVDETNAAFKLSDYKGKVVLVDFWGFW